MPTDILQSIDQLHSEWSKMDKATKLGWLMKEKIRLKGITNQLAQSYQCKGYFTPDEKNCAKCLIEMINSVDAEGTKVINELGNDVFKDLMKSLMTQ